jgi:2,3-bisphosphoglycerate-independent phosphoglycerate mutase
MIEEFRPRPVVLCILDGWGEAEDAADNAITRASTPVYDRLLRESARASIDTSGHHVGLPDGQMGNSEVGHQNIGAGRVVEQDLPRIDKAVADGSLAANPELQAMIAELRQTGGACHLIGLISPGGVHSHQDHIAALAGIVAAGGVPVKVHAVLDGRDTPPSDGLEYMRAFQSAVSAHPGVSIATVCGRYYAMDRDKRWDRVVRAYDVLTGASGPLRDSAHSAIETAYAEGQTDEFVTPTVIAGYDGMKDGDGLLMANFRADRARELLAALLDPEFDGFEREVSTDFVSAVGMVSYSDHLDRFMSVLFPAEPLQNTLGEMVAEAGLTQLRIAETEKYAHVTFFLNGGEERVFAGEDRILVPSPKVATYDLKPEMAAHEVTDRLCKAISGGTYDLIVVNYANPDMVGHTGVMAAALEAVETIDICLGRLWEAVREAAGVLLITADHGNIEAMMDSNGGPQTAHTNNKVPLLLVNVPAEMGLRDGRLADLAPTLLRLLGLAQPAEMTGNVLLTAAPARQRASA